LELRPGEPGYSGPAEEEFDDETTFSMDDPPLEPVAAVREAVSEKPAEAVPHTAVAAPRAREEAAASAAPPAESESEAERTPIAYNVPPPREVSGPTPNPRRGWWRR
jgi:hypothetical protein